MAGRAAHAWLDQFAYQVSLSPVPFLATGVAALGIALAAVSLQALPAVLEDVVHLRVDPATVLRGE